MYISVSLVIPCLVKREISTAVTFYDFWIRFWLVFRLLWYTSTYACIMCEIQMLFCLSYIHPRPPPIYYLTWCWCNCHPVHGIQEYIAIFSVTVWFLLPWNCCFMLTFCHIFIHCLVISIAIKFAFCIFMSILCWNISSCSDTLSKELGAILVDNLRCSNCFGRAV